MPKSMKKPAAEESAPLKKLVKITKSVSSKQKHTAPTANEPHPTGSKQSILITLLQRPTGATVEEMAKATGWQKHSVQGVMSGVLKKRLGLTITSDKEERGRVYRIAGDR